MFQSATTTVTAVDPVELTECSAPSSGGSYNVFNTLLYSKSSKYCARQIWNRVSVSRITDKMPLRFNCEHLSSMKTGHNS